MSLIRVNLDRYKDVAHKNRRIARSIEFEPLDKVIVAQIPGTDLSSVESQRQSIRDKYATAQTQIDSATTPEELKALLSEFENLIYSQG
jgi:DNA phosphorothioation-dependent restriction protein DptG